MRYNLTMPQFSAELHDKYAPESIALCDVFSPSQRKISLREFCTILGLSYDGLNDDEVKKYFRQKRVREIAEHSERDVMRIFQIWLRRELYNGRLSYHEFRESEANPTSRMAWS
jgi:Predicted 3'-5' exonuclease related to the exonuclease domain of PolB